MIYQYLWTGQRNVGTTFNESLQKFNYVLLTAHIVKNPTKNLAFK